MMDLLNMVWDEATFLDKLLIFNASRHGYPKKEVSRLLRLQIESFPIANIPEGYCFRDCY
ncbi:hypothetical protein [Sulfidibacter corallicola]|uniref:Uncharacterized protein n=1 Tax=Sulfidibacter corallicola TaxID=2818388 RepID=A0A8A4TP29_SULCO|nr:hypothetical protein [Sulfidibacter corallicola]QTD50718.1 hypothetical protein J3U87_34460 [Sulfidibacter corallicola]